MKTLMLILGVIAVAMGLLWVGQGTGYVHWPQTSFMISQMELAYYGGGLAVVGLILIWMSRR
jgi:uncharacterized membrane protein